MSDVQGHSFTYPERDTALAAEVLADLHADARRKLPPNSYYEIRSVPPAVSSDFGRGPALEARIAWVLDPDDAERDCPNMPRWIDYKGYFLHWTGRT